MIFLTTVTNWKNIKNSDQEGDENGIFHSHHSQPDRELQKGNAHNQSIGADTDKQRSHHIFLNEQKYLPPFFIQLKQTETGQPIVVCRNKKGGNN